MPELYKGKDEQQFDCLIILLPRDPFAPIAC